MSIMSFTHTTNQGFSLPLFLSSVSLSLSFRTVPTFFNLVKGKTSSFSLSMGSSNKPASTFFLL